MTSATYVKSLDYYKNLVKYGKMPGLNSGGQVLKSQSTATKKSHITVTKQLRWHTPVDDVWEKMQETNLPPDSFVNHMENFQINLDESCFMENDGSLMIIGGSNRKKHENRLYESHISIMLIRIGNDYGNEVPWIFLYKVNQILTSL